MTEQMKAVRFYGPKEIKTELVDRPVLKGGSDVKVRIGAAGICGSDLHVYETGAYVTQIPVVMGHEFAGVVVETGPDVTDLKPGDHVVGDSRVACGTCEFCGRGLPNLCDNIGFLGEVQDGAYAEEVVVDRSLLIGIDSGVPFHMAALAEPLAVALHAVSRVNLARHKRALVIGAGPIGALVHCLLKLKGIDDAFITDLSEFRRNAVKSRSPESVVDPSDNHDQAGGYDLVFETTGAGAVLTKVIPEALVKKGALVMVGLFGAPAEFDFTQLVEFEWTVSGCAAFSDELPEAARVLESHWSDMEYIVSHRLSLDDGQKAIDTLLDPGKKAMKIVFEG